MFENILEKIKLMQNFLSKTYSFIKNFMFYLIYYKPTKAALNYIQNFVSPENFLEGICERLSESVLIEYYQKMEYNNINIYDYDNKTIDLLYENLVDGNYTSLMLMITSNPNMRINDYYCYYLLIKNNQLLKEKLFENKNFHKHIIQFIKKSKIKFNDKLSFKIKFKNNHNHNIDNNIENNISCMSCYEDLNNTYYSCCKRCKTELDLSCLNQWIKMDKNTCITCRINLLDDNESYNLILLQKYLDYLIISKELDLYRFDELPS